MHTDRDSQVKCTRVLCTWVGFVCEISCAVSVGTHAFMIYNTMPFIRITLIEGDNQEGSTFFSQLEPFYRRLLYHMQLTHVALQFIQKIKVFHKRVLRARNTELTMGNRGKLLEISIAIQLSFANKDTADNRLLTVLGLTWAHHY